MSTIDLDQPVPNFNFNATNHLSTSLSEFSGRPVILYFYPKDNSPGCTSESKDFRDKFDEIQKYNAVILGVSRDNMASHEKFKNKLHLPFELISDPDETLCQLFDVMRLKNMLAKRFIGIERSTFLIDGKAVLRQAWRKVKVAGHVDEVICALKDI